MKIWRSQMPAKSTGWPSTGGAGGGKGAVGDAVGDADGVGVAVTGWGVLVGQDVPVGDGVGVAVGTRGVKVASAVGCGVGLSTEVGTATVAPGVAVASGDGVWVDDTAWTVGVGNGGCVAAVGAHGETPAKPAACEDRRAGSRQASSTATAKNARKQTAGRLPKAAPRRNDVRFRRITHPDGIVYRRLGQKEVKIASRTSFLDDPTAL